MKRERLRYDSDRTVDSTENNEYTEDFRDENLVDENLLDVDIPLDDRIPDGVNEERQNDRPLYDEEGYRKDLF